MTCQVQRFDPNMRAEKDCVTHCEEHLTSRDADERMKGA